MFLCSVAVVCDLLCFVVSYFFFFKQKTAYEMRISDWSSGRVLFRSQAEIMPFPFRHPIHSGIDFLQYDIRRAEGLVRLAPQLLNAQRTKQIGRASCRERVCQYV